MRRSLLAASLCILILGVARGQEQEIVIQKVDPLNKDGILELHAKDVKMVIVVSRDTMKTLHRFDPETKKYDKPRKIASVEDFAKELTRIIAKDPNKVARARVKVEENRIIRIEVCDPPDPSTGQRTWPPLPPPPPRPRD